MTKKKSKSNVMFIVAGFLVLLGVLMMYNSYVSNDKGLIASGIFSIVIGGVLIFVSRKSAKRRRR